MLISAQEGRAALPLVSACTGASLPQSRLTSILTPLVTGIYTPLIGLPVVGSTLLSGVGGIVSGALSGAPIGLDVLTVGGGVLTPGSQCSQQADGFTIATPKGLTIGGNSIDGLGADGLSANAGEIGSIALGNSAATGNLATNSIALGTGATVTGTSPNAIAVGTGASANAAQQIAIGQVAGVGAGTGATGAIALGYAAGTNVAGAQNIGIGSGAGVTSGAGTNVSGVRNVAIGTTDGVVNAAGTNVTGNDNVAIGTGAGVGVIPNNTVAIGRNALGAATGSVALGSGATTIVANSVALGSGSTIVGAPTGLGFNVASAAPLSQVEVGGRRVTGVSAGAAPTDAVNVSQLAGTANNLAGTLGGSFNAAGTYTAPTYTTAAGTTSTTVQGALTNQTAAMTQLGNAAAANVGAGATYTPGTGVLSAPSFPVANVSATGAVGLPTVATSTGAAVAGLSTDVTNLANGLTSGTVGLVQQGVAGTPITVGAATDGTSVNFTGTAGTRRLSGVTAGIAASDAATVGQVGAAVGAATANEVQYDALGGVRANSITLAGGALGPVAITNVAPGSLLPGSTDAVNGSQLGATNATVAVNTTAITSLNNGTAGIVQQVGGSPGLGALTVGAGTGGGIVSFAGTSGSRILSGVTAGIAPTDAANVGQVTAAVGAATANGVEYDVVGGVRGNSVTLAGGALGPVTVTNVAAGSLLPGSTDAVNGSQLGATNTNVTANTTAITNLNNGTAGLVQQAAAGAPITVGAANGGTSVSIAGTGGTRTLGGVSAGFLATDAANVGQLAGATGSLATTLGGSFDAFGVYTPPTYTTAGGTTATTVQGALTNETAATTQLGNAAAANAGGGATYTPGTGVLSAPTYTIANISATGAVGLPTTATNTGAAVAGLSTDVVNLATNLNNGTVGLVQQVLPGAPLTVGAATDGASVDFTGTAGTRRLSGITAGIAPTDAANVAQVTAAVGTATANGVDYDVVGGVRTNTVTLAGGALGPVTVTNVAAGSLTPGSTDAVNGSQLAATNTNVTNNTTAITNLNNGTAGLVQQALAGAPLTVGSATGGTSVDFTGTAGARRLSGIAAGVAATDAVNLGQVGTLIGAATVSSPLQYSDASAPTTATPGVTSNSTTLVGLTAGTAVALHNVAAGGLSSTSTDAVNGSQLFATNTAISAITSGGGVRYFHVNSTRPDSSALGTDSVAVGANAVADGGQAVAIGADNRAYGAGAVAIGDPNYASGLGAFTGGENNIANSDGTATATAGNQANGAVAIGNGNRAIGQGSVALGNTSTAAAPGGVAIGDTATATNARDVALGSGAVTTAPVATGGATIAGTAYAFSGTAPTSAFSIGAPGAERQLQNVAAGQLSAASTDAVNGSQLFASNSAINAQGLLLGALGPSIALQFGGGTTYNAATGLLGGGTYQAGTTGGTYTSVAAALANIVTGPVGSDPGAVHYTDATHSAVVLGDVGAAPVAVTNVANGSVTAGSLDAVNGGQLAATNSNITANSTAVTNLNNQIANGTIGLVQQAGGPGAGDITIGASTGGAVISAANNAGAARRVTGVATGAVTAGSVDAVNGSQLFAVSQAQAASNALSVQYTADAAGNPTAAIDLTKGGAIAATTISGVAAGAVAATSTQAVNGAQLYSTNAHVAGDTAALGGGAAFNPATGAYTSPTYTVQGAAMNTVGGAVAALDSAVGRALVATANSVQYDDATHAGLTLNSGGAATTIHNVAAGTAAGDAVNVGQLQSASNATLAAAEGYTDQRFTALNYDLRRRIDSTGAKGAALAGVPQSINPGSGFVGASVGGQGSEVAFAMGVSKVFDGAHLPVLKAGVSVDVRGYSASYNVGAGIHF